MKTSSSDSQNGMKEFISMAEGDKRIRSSYRDKAEPLFGLVVTGLGLTP
jgi:hypothetical protein